jgi:signal transduction histidine kinase
MAVEAPLRVLLVEDNQADARLLREYVREPGFPQCVLTRVETIAQAVAAATPGAFDAVLVDLSLPDAHGLDAVTRLHRASPDVPIVVLTGLEDESLALRAVQAGAQDYLVKSQVSAQPLARALRYAVERSRLEAAHKREEGSARAAQLREQFIAILSHDLRGPLTSIAMNAGLLIDKAELGERHLKTVMRIARSAERMNRMIRDLLDFTRARLGGGFELVRAPAGLADVCRQVVEEMEAVHHDRKVELSIRGRGWGTWDADRMAQVLSNLISNAFQYSPPDTPVRISLGEEGPNVVVEVNNDGELIPGDVLPVIFDPYFRVRARGGTGSSQGLGLGLYIASQIVIAHGGRIDVRSMPNEGTTFRVLLPHGSAGASPR